MDENLTLVVIVTIDNQKWWKDGICPTSKSYYSDLYDTEAEVKEFLKQVDKDFPDNSMQDFKHNHEWLIRYMRFRVDPQNQSELESIKELAKAQKHYSEAKGECSL
jgi:hypothetical protein